VTTTEDLERAMSLAEIHAPARWLETVGSTNTEAVAWAELGAEEFSLIGASHQTAGRGRLGRGWDDEPGGALMFSFVLRPSIGTDYSGLLPLLAGAAMAAAAREVGGADVMCKWPNDLTLGGDKVGGILAESSVDGARFVHVVIGLGVNLVPPAGVPGAAGLGARIDPMELLEGFLRRFGEGYRGDEAGFGSRVRESWRRVSATLGREVEAIRTDGETIRGEAVDVDERGGLVIRSAAGPVTVRSGEIEHLR
jgi:BirA family biotin operon repressor/biotin-[acetyl-CoA-carboxylase] ligase